MMAGEKAAVRSLHRLRLAYEQHRDFFLVLGLFSVLQLMLLVFFGPGGRFGDYSDYWYYAEMASRVDSGYYPYLHYWVEYPPLFPWLPLLAYWLSRLLPPAPDPLLWFYVVYGALMGLFAVGNLTMIYKLGLKVYDQRGALRCTVFYALLFGPIFVHAGYFDGVALFFMLLSLLLLFENRSALSGAAAALGAMVKVLPVALVPVGFKILPRRWRYLASVGLVALIVNLPFYLLNPTMFAASWQALLTTPSWETVWALLDGYYSYGLAIGNRFDPAQAGGGLRPEAVPWPAVLIVFGFVYLLLYLLPWQQPLSERKQAGGRHPLRLALAQFRSSSITAPEPVVYRIGVIAFVGLSLNLFMIFSRGYSPQFVLWYLPFLVLALPNGWGLAYATLLTVDSVIERVLYFFVVPDSHWFLAGTVLFRTVLMLLMVPEYLGVMGFLPLSRWQAIRRIGLASMLLAGVAGVVLGMGAFVHDYTQQRYLVSPYRQVIDQIRSAAGDGDGVVVTSRAAFDAVAPFLPEQTVWIFGRDDGEFRPGAFEAQWERILADHPRIWLMLDYAGGQAADWNAYLVQRLDGIGYKTTDDWIGPEQRLLHYATTPPEVVRTEEVGAVFGDGLRLQRLQLDGLPLRPGDVLRLQLRWDDQSESGVERKVFVHLISEQGQIGAQRDLPLLTERPVQRFGVLLPQDLPAGSYQLKIGVYDPATGERLPVRNMLGEALAQQPAADGLVLAGVEVK